MSRLRVTIEDLDEGTRETEEVPENDYLLITTGTVETHIQAYANGTHVITVKGRGRLTRG